MIKPRHLNNLVLNYYYVTFNVSCNVLILFWSENVFVNCSRRICRCWTWQKPSSSLTNDRLQGNIHFLRSYGSVLKHPVNHFTEWEINSVSDQSKWFRFAKRFRSVTSSADSKEPIQLHSWIEESLIIIIIKWIIFHLFLRVSTTFLMSSDHLQSSFSPLDGITTVWILQI